MSANDSLLPDHKDTVQTLLRKICSLFNNLSGCLEANENATVGSSFKTIPKVVIDNVNTSKQCVGFPSPRGVQVSVLATNSGTIYVGSKDVTKGNGEYAGIPLLPGGMVNVIIPVSTSDQVFVAGDTLNDVACITVL